MSDKEILTRAYNAFNERNLESAIALMHPDVVWPNGWEGGIVTGHEGVRAYWTRQWAAIDPHVEPTAFAPTIDGRLVVTVESRVRDLEGNVMFSGVVEHIYTIEDGLIRAMEIQHQS